MAHFSHCSHEAVVWVVGRIFRYNRLRNIWMPTIFSRSIILVYKHTELGSTSVRLEALVCADKWIITITTTSALILSSRHQWIAAPDTHIYIWYMIYIYIYEYIYIYIYMIYIYIYIYIIYINIYIYISYYWLFLLWTELYRSTSGILFLK